MQTDRQTDRQANTLITIGLLRSLPGAEQLSLSEMALRLTAMSLKCQRVRFLTSQRHSPIATKRSYNAAMFPRPNVRMMYFERIPAQQFPSISRCYSAGMLIRFKWLLITAE